MDRDILYTGRLGDCILAGLIAIMAVVYTWMAVMIVMIPVLWAFGPIQIPIDNHKVVIQFVSARYANAITVSIDDSVYCLTPSSACPN